MSAVMPKDTARSRAEPNQQCPQRTECDPISIPVLRLCAPDVVTKVIAGDAEEGHGYDPSYEGANGGEGREEGHKNCACTVVASTAQTKED